METVTAAQEVARDWLAMQCRLLPGVHHALILLGEPDQGRYQPAVCWPVDAAAAPALTDTLTLAIGRRQPVFGKLPATAAVSTTTTDVAALPLMIDGRLLGGVAFQIARPADTHQRAIVSMLRIGVAWLEFLIGQNTRERMEHLESLVALVAAVGEHADLEASAAALATTLATQFGCERASVGLRTSRHCRLQALSHSARFDRRTHLVRDIESAMDEAVAQDASLAYPPLDERTPTICVAQRELTRHGAHAVLTLPLAAQGTLIGAITLERGADKPFDAATAQRCRQSADMIAPLIESKRLAAQPLLPRLWRTVCRPGGRAASRRALTLSLAALIALACTWLATATTIHEVTAPATLEGTVQRAVVAPRDGFISSAAVSAGDVVTAQQLLAALDDRDLQLERVKWLSEREQLDRKYREVFASKERAEATVLNAQRAQADAQLALIDEQLARGQLLAPFDGVIVKGDLKHSLGAPVKRGDVLLEVAPLDGYRVIVEVDERNMATLEGGERGRLVLTARPQEPLPVVVDKITPVASASEGRNRFRVEALLEETSPLLRPGMHGIAKLEAGQRTHLWIWTHPFIDWLRLKLWSWLP